MAKKTTSARISVIEEKFLSEKFGTASAGLAECANIVFQTKVEPTEIVDSINYLNQIRLYSLREIKGKLTENEWKYLADSLNGTLITPEFRCNAGGLIASIEDSNDFDNFSEKYEVKVSDFCKKIKDLTGAQIDAIYTRVQQFWSNPKNLDGWSKW